MAAEREISSSHPKGPPQSQATKANPQPTNGPHRLPIDISTHQVTSEGGKSSAKPTSITTASGGSIEHNLQGESCLMFVGFSTPTPKCHDELDISYTC